MPVTIDLDHYKQKGWVIIEDAVPTKYLQIVKEKGLYLRQNSKDFSDWKGIACASKHIEELWDCYTAPFMFEIAQRILGEQIWLLNDQVVYKLPNDRFVFPEHCDNEYGNENKNGQIHTINCSWILDDFLVDNGTLSLLNKDDDEWVTIYPQEKDIVVINGNTIHKSSQNKSNKERGLYACVYSESPITIEGF